ncbi:hypothetical protein DFH07DRAFT_47847 [Mycena maculata]|uniref:Uncharacterized protein n=1 Tax=Mycena maculata TaxID=230809 RepID=A0AAD7NVD4_9AGAR|nr:hypothetical protein DFH07DRAFT_47847 [Mycena maculata]
MHSLLETVPSYRVPSTQGALGLCAASPISEGTRTTTSRTMCGRSETSRATWPFFCSAQSRVPVPPPPYLSRLCVPPIPSPAHASPMIGLLEPPVSYVSSLSRWSSTASSISFLSSHSSDDGLTSLPGSPYPLPGSPSPLVTRDFWDRRWTILACELIVCLFDDSSSA